jgi:hypothetical protein
MVANLLLLMQTDGGSPVAAMRVAQADSSRPQGRPDGAAVDAELGTDSGHRLPPGVQVNGLIDLFGVQSLAAHDDALAVQVRRDGDAVYAETGGQLADRRPGAVTVGKRRHLRSRQPGHERPTTTRRAVPITLGEIPTDRQPFRP